MTYFTAFIIIAICFLVFSQTYWIWSMNQLRRQGKLPEKGKATMFDVRRLLVEGEKEAAVRLYCDIFKVHRKKALKDIEELERSIKHHK